MFARSPAWSTSFSLAHSSARFDCSWLACRGLFWRGLALLGCCLVLALSSRGARAQAATEPGPSVSWSAPSECPDGPYVQTRINALLGPPKPGGDLRASVQANGVISHGRAGYKLVLTVQGPEASGARTLLGADCAALSETAAWLVAVTIDENVPPEGTAPSEPPPPEPVQPSEPQPVPAPPPKTPPTLVPSRPSRWSLHGSLFGGLSATRPADPRPQLGASLGVGYDFWLLELRAAFSPTDTEDIPGSAQGTARSRSQSYGLALCTLWGGRLRAGPCANVALNASWAESRDVQNDRHSDALWAAASLGGQASLEVLDHLELLAEGGMQGPISRSPRFIFGPDGERQTLFGPPTLGYYARIGVRFRWPLAPRPGVERPTSPGAQQ